MKTYVLYHGPTCLDGFGAAWAAWKAFGRYVTYIPVQYDQPLPDLPDAGLVYIVDFSYPRAALEALHARLGGGPLLVFDHPAADLEGLPYCARLGGPLLVFDHHKSAAADLEGLPYCTFDMDKSGAALAWEAFHGSDLPPLIQYVQDRDLWRFALPNSREVSAWLRSHTLDFDLWNLLAEMLQTKFNVVVAEGGAILRMQSQMVAQMADRARWEEIGGHRVPIANATAFFSEVGEELCLRHPKAPFSAYYLVRADGLCQLGLRSRGEFDVSLIAKQYGGGGHRNAAGFVAGLSSAVNVPDPRTPA